MATRAFQANAFQFAAGKVAFQDPQTVTATGTFGISNAFSVAAKATLKGPVTYATAWALSSAFGLTFFNASVLGFKAGEASAAGASLKAPATLALKGAAAASLAGTLRAAASLGSREGASGAAGPLLTALATLGLRGGLAPSPGTATRGGAATIGAQLAATASGRQALRATTSYGLSEALLNRQKFINPALFINVSRLSFQHGISHRGGGKGPLARKALRQVEARKAPPTFEEFLKRWKPKPYAPPARLPRTKRDLRPPPKVRLPDGDHVAIARDIQDAFDRRDAFAVLEQLLRQEQDAQDERDAHALISALP